MRNAPKGKLAKLIGRLGMRRKKREHAAITTFEQKQIQAKMRPDASIVLEYLQVISEEERRPEQGYFEIESLLEEAVYMARSRVENIERDTEVVVDIPPNIQREYLGSFTYFAMAISRVLEYAILRTKKDPHTGSTIELTVQNSFKDAKKLTVEVRYIPRFSENPSTFFSRPEENQDKTNPSWFKEDRTRIFLAKEYIRQCNGEITAYWAKGKINIKITIPVEFTMKDKKAALGYRPISTVGDLRVVAISKNPKSVEGIKRFLEKRNRHKVRILTEREMQPEKIKKAIASADIAFIDEDIVDPILLSLVRANKNSNKRPYTVKIRKLFSAQRHEALAPIPIFIQESNSNVKDIDQEIEKPLLPKRIKEVIDHSHDYFMAIQNEESALSESRGKPSSNHKKTEKQPDKQEALLFIDDYLQKKDQLAGGERKIKGLRILVVDDNEINRKLVSRMLDLYEVEYDIAKDGKEAVEMYLKQEKTKRRNVSPQALMAPPYDLILMDINMPNMDGYQATQKIKKESRTGENAEIVALTALSLKNEKAKMLKAGFAGFLPKPIKAQKLDAAMIVAAKKGEAKYGLQAKEEGLCVLEAPLFSDLEVDYEVFKKIITDNRSVFDEVVYEFGHYLLYRVP